MDMASQHAIAFLEALQDAMQGLGQIHTHYVRGGTAPARPFLVLSGRPFSIHEAGGVRRFRGDVALGLSIRGAEGREYELAVDVLWADDGWTITTEAWVEADTGGQDLLRNLPERSAVDLSGCIRQPGEAIGDLLRFGDLVPGEGGRA